MAPMPSPWPATLPRAQGGQILVSEVLRTVDGSLAGLGFRDAGRKQLKGIGRQRLYEVVWE